MSTRVPPPVAAIAACCLATGLAPGSATAGPEIIGQPGGEDIVTVRIGEAETSLQELPIFPGISGNTAGAQGISMLRVVIPPGAQAKAHIHRGYETAIYLMQGRVLTRYGEGLAKSVVNEAGDFIYIPADVPHRPENLSLTEPAIAIVARTDPNEQESVELYEVPDE